MCTSVLDSNCRVMDGLDGVLLAGEFWKNRGEDPSESNWVSITSKSVEAIDQLELRRPWIYVNGRSSRCPLHARRPGFVSVLLSPSGSGPAGLPHCECLNPAAAVV